LFGKDEESVNQLLTPLGISLTGPLSALYLGGGPPLTRGRGATSADNGRLCRLRPRPDGDEVETDAHGMHLTVEMRRGLVKSRRIDSTHH